MALNWDKPTKKSSITINLNYIMNDKQNTLRLLYPQWQGGVITSWFPDLSPKDASTGYNLGAKLLNLLTPENPDQVTVEVPVSLDYNNESAEKGISLY